ncbi:MAG: division/cell wall cluster transcriptional repressor MraZ [Alphaproteobacteria bacterium]
MSVPATFRQAVVGSRHNGVVCFRSFVNDAIEGMSMEQLDDISDDVGALDAYSEERDAFASVVMSDVQVLNFDGDGRIMLPEKLITHADLSDMAAFVGQGDRFFIWNPDRWEEHSERARKIALEKRAALRGRRGADSGGTKDG